LLPVGFCILEFLIPESKNSRIQKFISVCEVKEERPENELSSEIETMRRIKVLFLMLTWFSAAATCEKNIFGKNL
jgi:hypothetical protein